MRVTRLIREYVEKTVTERISYGEPTKAFAEAKRLMEEERAAAERDIKAYAEMRLGNVNDRMPMNSKSISPAPALSILPITTRP